MKPTKSYIAISIIALTIFFLVRGCPISLSEKLTEVIIRGQTFSVKVADQPVKRAKGLTGQASLPEEQGMLFVFDRPDFHSFWMKDMNFPLDIIWIEDSRIVDLVTNAPVPEDNKVYKYIPERQAKYVLEINAGLADQYGWRVGDKVRIKFD